MHRASCGGREEITRPLQGCIAGTGWDIEQALYYRRLCLACKVVSYKIVKRMNGVLYKIKVLICVAGNMCTIQSSFLHCHLFLYWFPCYLSANGFELRKHTNYTRET